MLQLHEKWQIISEIYHTKLEFDRIFSLLQCLGGGQILDCACGTGFPSIGLRAKNFHIVGSDKDNEALSLLKNNPLFVMNPFPVHNVAWEQLSTKFNQKFNVILCLGSSITYYDTWDESIGNIPERDDQLPQIISNFRKILAPNGKLILGICKLYNKDRGKDTISFPQHIVNGITYKMNWELQYDWNRRVKTWLCEIAGSNGSKESCCLLSHLYDKEELKNICKRDFSIVKELDFLPESYHDNLIICKV